MALALSPRKIVPLASGEDRKHHRTNSTVRVTKRVFFCGVVVEGSENGRTLREDVQDLVVSLGVPLDSGPDMNASLNGRPDVDRSANRMRATTDFSALADVISELLSTERSYLKRLRTLKLDYADPLRKFSRSKDTAILAPYEAKTLFGNIDSLLPVNEAFLADLEKLVAQESTRTIGGIGDVALKHFKALRGFEHYKQYYIKREEAQSIFEREMMKRSSGFAAFVDRIKYSSADTKNRVGLRELLINPVQRIPQYTLLFRTMMKHMALGDPQRAKLVEAEEIASRIALAETDEQTKRAAIMYCLSSTVDGFPPGLISNSRRFIDCIDVEDHSPDAPMSSAASSSGSSTLAPLHCTLFLFDDKLIIVKRPGNGEKSGKALAGLNGLEKITKGGLPLGMKKSGMICKGVVDVADVVATDVGGPDIHLYLENPPQDQGDRWSGRSFRSLSVEHPPLPVNLDPTGTEAEKKRFLENLWNVQAKFRTKAGQSVALCADDAEVESRGGKVTIARTYFNIYQRTAFLQENKKTKIVVHIDASGSADPIPFGVNAPPFVVVRVQPMAGELSRYTVTSSDANDEGEEDIVQTARVPSRIVQTIQQFGLFKFRTGGSSLPSTPTANKASRASIFGLDVISRNLFGSKQGSSMGDIFNGSVNGRKRSKSTTSRSSIYTQTTSTGDDSLTKFSRRSNSTATAATTVSITDDDSLGTRRSNSKSRKLLKRSKSPAPSESELDKPSPSRRSSRAESTPPRPRSQCDERRSEGGLDDESHARVLHKMDMDESEWDLTMRLELARKNSNQHGKQATAIAFEKPLEETIYEDQPPLPMRPASRVSRDTASQHSTIRPDSATPTKGSSSPPRHCRSSSEPSDRRLFGPRSPSPLPQRNLLMHSSSSEIPSADDHPAMEAPGSPEATTQPHHSPLPRSKRLPFLPTGNTEITPKPTTGNASVPPSSVEPLSIKKKISVRSTGTPTPSRKSNSQNSPLARNSSRVTPTRRNSQQARIPRMTTNLDNSAKSDITDRIIRSVQSSRDDVDSSRRAVKRIKFEMEEIWSGANASNDGDYEKHSSPDKGSRTLQNGAPMTRAAQERMEEMRQLIGKRQGDPPPRSRARSMVDSTPGSRVSDSPQANGSMRSLEELISNTDKYLTRAIKCHDVLQTDLEQLRSDYKERTDDLEKTRVELQNSKRQCELMKSLLENATSENDIMFEAFNEELDAMYNDVNLPEDEALVAMSNDLRQAKAARNALRKESAELRQRLAEMEVQKEEWGKLLRTHGLIP